MLQAETEARYAIDIEMLGIVSVVKKCRVFLQGLQHFEMVTDHISLLIVINKYHLNEIENPHLQRLKMKLISCNLVATWRLGKDHLAADALSRAPLDAPTAEEEKLEHHVWSIIAANHNAEIEDLQLVYLKAAAYTDS